MNLFGMQRSNGDWFAIREPTRFRVPLFSSVDEARATRAFNVDLLVCRAVLFDERALKQVAELEADRGVYFWLVEQYSRNMRRGTALERDEVQQMFNETHAQVLTRD